MSVVNHSSKVKGHIDGSFSKLLDTSMLVMKDETRIWMLKKLLDKNISTNDVYAFASSQAGLRLYEKVLDKNTVVAAMHAKIRDLKASLRLNYKSRTAGIKELHELLDGKSYALRKKLRTISTAIKIERIKFKEKYKVKINHLEKKQKKNQISQNTVSNLSTPTVAPSRLSCYETLSIFGTSDDLPKKKPPKGPFICDTKIPLTRSEYKLLSKDPKFNLLIEPSEIDYRTEIERGLCKHRYNMNKDGRGKKLSDILPNSVLDGPTGIELTSKEQREEQERLDEIYRIFKENSGRYIFNPTTKTVNFNRRNSSDYKLNKTISLPRSLNSEAEFECEMRRREFMESFIEYKNKNAQSRVKANDKDSDKESNDVVVSETSDKTVISEKKCKDTVKTSYKSGNVLNLTKDEREAMESIKKRIQNKEIMVTQTDKSGRFALLTHDQYIHSGNKHTSKDKKVTWKDINYLQGQVNNHTWWCSKVLGYGTGKEEGKMLKNIQGTSLEILNEGPQTVVGVLR